MIARVTYERTTGQVMVYLRPKREPRDGQFAQLFVGGEERDVPEEEVQDATGELANIIAGNLDQTLPRGTQRGQSVRLENDHRNPALFPLVADQFDARNFLPVANSSCTALPMPDLVVGGEQRWQFAVVNKFKIFGHALGRNPSFGDILADDTDGNPGTLHLQQVFVRVAGVLDGKFPNGNPRRILRSDGIVHRVATQQHSHLAASILQSMRQPKDSVILLLLGAAVRGLKYAQNLFHSQPSLYFVGITIVASDSSTHL